MSTRTASVGRIVHYVSYGTPGGEFTKQCRAAVVTSAEHDEDDVCVSLAVLNPTGFFFDEHCRYDAGARTADRDKNAEADSDYAGGTWHWPEPVE